MKTSDKITGTSLDISAENRARLKVLFPAVFTETVNDMGELVESVDFKKLKAEPMQFICLDSAFGGNDQLKVNAVQTFNARNMGKEKHNQIVFRTV